MRIALVCNYSEERRPQAMVLKKSFEEIMPEIDWQGVLHKNVTTPQLLAYRPQSILKTFSKGYDVVIAAGADTKLYRRLYMLWGRTEWDVMLTPHLVELLPDRIKHPDYIDIGHAGMFNADFQIWTNTEASRKVLLEYSKHLAESCKNLAGQFYDQTFLNFLPGILKTKICTDPGINYAYWRAYSWPKSPIYLAHFSGLDFAHPDRVSIYTDREVCQEFRQMCVEYAKEVENVST